MCVSECGGGGGGVIHTNLEKFVDFTHEIQRSEYIALSQTCLCGYTIQIESNEVPHFLAEHFCSKTNS